MCVLNAQKNFHWSPVQYCLLHLNSIRNFIFYEIIYLIWFLSFSLSLFISHSLFLFPFSRRTYLWIASVVKQVLSHKFFSKFRQQTDERWWIIHETIADCHHMSGNSFWDFTFVRYNIIRKAGVPHVCVKID